MFTVKYRMTDGGEMVDGPFEHISKSVNAGGQPIVTAWKNLTDNESMSYGPVDLERLTQDVAPTVWVMNAQGATVATYYL